jgi:hypothetical protein
MTLKKKIMFAIAALLASKHSIASSITAAAIGASLAPALGFDPWTWIIGAIGGIVVRVKLPPTTRIDSLVNGVISVMLAGLASPWAVTITIFDKLPTPSVYLVAFVIAAAWPWLVSFGWGLFKRKAEKVSEQ